MRPLYRIVLILLTIFALSAVLGAQTAKPAANNVCLDCHSNMDGELQVNAADYTASVHGAKGMTCASCHGGDPTDEGRAMTPAAGFRGKIDRAKVPELCGSCHSDPAKMRQYNPSLRTDQLTQYRTSVHGKKFAAGDTHVAVCTDCHGVHDIRRASDPLSRVHPTNVATTCKRCHADSNYMKAYNIPTDQFASYTSSVHFEAMTVRGDLSAPTCTTCHGNHGAAPPGVTSVANVCSTCHVFQAQMFDASPHKAVFTNAGMPGCVTCHSNHHIKHPTDANIGTGQGSFCTNCHSSGDKGFETAAAISSQLAGLGHNIERSRQILERAERSGMEVSEAKLDLSKADDALTKARVAVHTFTPAKVNEEVRAGTATAEKTYTAGVNALKERNFRREGLGASIVAVLFVLVGLGFYIREIERKR